MSTFRTNIKLGAKYRDTNTGFIGTATTISFFQHGCERVCLKGMNSQGEIVDYYFDSPELENVKTRKPVTLIERKTGGPHDRIAPAGERREGARR